MTRHADAIGRAYEQLARMRKTARIVARVPVGTSPAANDRTADMMAGWSVEDRNIFAATAGARPPSDETWRAVCEAVRNRVTPANDQAPGDHPFMRGVR